MQVFQFVNLHLQRYVCKVVQLSAVRPEADIMAQLCSSWEISAILQQYKHKIHLYVSVYILLIYQMSDSYKSLQKKSLRKIMKVSNDIFTNSVARGNCYENQVAHSVT